MNKQNLSAQTKVPVNSIDSIFCAMGLPKDLPDYSDEHVNLIQAVRDLHKNEGCKSWAEAVGLYRKPINESQLKEIAARYSMGDRIPELISALKLKPESITTEQFEQFRVVCEQVQQGMDLGMVANAQLEKGKASKPQPGSGNTNQAVGAALAQRQESTLTTDRPFPAIVEQYQEIDGIPLDGDAAAAWSNLSKVGAAVEADKLATAPFDGMIETAERIRNQAANLKQRGSNQFLQDFNEAFNDPALIERVKEQALGKLPPEWADRLNSMTKD